MIIKAWLWKCNGCGEEVENSSAKSLLNISGSDFIKYEAMGDTASIVTLYLHKCSPKKADGPEPYYAHYGVMVLQSARVEEA